MMPAGVMFLRPRAISRRWSWSCGCPFYRRKRPRGSAEMFFRSIQSRGVFVASGPGDVLEKDKGPCGKRPAPPEGAAA